MKKFTFILIALLVLSLPVFSKTEGIEKVISVTGHGEINIEPNVAYMRFGVEAIEDDAAKAQRANAKRMKKLIEALKGLGIEEDKIETSSFSLNPLTRRVQGKKPRIVGYRCDNSVMVTINNLNLIGKVIDTGIAAGANNVSNLSFSVKDESKYKLMALEKAIDDAREKARSIEKAARLQIKKIYSIIEQGSEVRPYRISRSAVAMMEAAPETPIMSGKVKITADVRVNFEY